MNVENCLSCGMDLHEESRRTDQYCKNCTRASGELQPFEERFERMTQWAMRKDGLSREHAEKETREYMRTMPAWRDHPALEIA